jgi:hypothetical protein
MVAISEVLALGALSKQAFNCPYSQARRHDKTCTCRGTRRLTTCLECEGAGWHNGGPCRYCWALGALSAPPLPPEPKEKP